jgi:hypothetical protein
MEPIPGYWNGTQQSIATQIEIGKLMRSALLASLLLANFGVSVSRADDVTIFNKDVVNVIDRIGVCSKHFREAMRSGYTEVSGVRYSVSKAPNDDLYLTTNVTFQNHIPQSRTAQKLYKNLNVQEVKTQNSPPVKCVLLTEAGEIVTEVGNQ